MSDADESELAENSNPEDRASDDSASEETQTDSPATEVGSVVETAGENAIVEESVDPDFAEFECDYGDASLDNDVRSVLEPIEPGNPCGAADDEAESVVAQIEANIEPVFESIKSDFKSVIENDDMSGFDATLSGSDAVDLIEKTLDCLRDQCKSSILASHLPKLMLIAYGLPGFRAGVDIYREILRRFGTSVFPKDSERVKQFFRGAVYIGNDDKVTETFRLLLYIPVTESKNLPYALLRNSRLKQADSNIESRYAREASESSSEFYVKLINNITKAIESCQLANEATSMYINTPGAQVDLVSFQFIKSLEKMRGIVTNLATEHCDGYPPVESVEADGSEESQTVASGPKAQVAQGEIVSREQAIELLKKIGDYFHRTERHSPISYSIRKLVDWAKMDLPDLIEELLDGNSEPLGEFYKRTGIRPKSEEESG